MLATNHEELASQITADNPVTRGLLGPLLHGNLSYAAAIDGLVSQQAAMIAYIDNFFLMLVTTAAALPIVFLLKGSKAKSGAGRAPVADQ